MQPLIEQLANQLLTSLIGGLVAALVAAVGVGGVLWKKLAVNEAQDKRLARLENTVHTMASHQLIMACERALAAGCISIHDMQELQRLYDDYAAQGWNGPGKVIFDKVKLDVDVREECDKE